MIFCENCGATFDAADARAERIEKLGDYWSHACACPNCHSTDLAEISTEVNCSTCRYAAYRFWDEVYYCTNQASEWTNDEVSDNMSCREWRGEDG